MSEIPEDIIKAADDVCIALNIPSTVDNCEPIMAALIAERKRCSDAAFSQASRWSLGEATTLYGQGYQTACRVISRVISPSSEPTP